MESQTGNLLDVSEGIIVHGCNAQGVMGSGVAAAVRQKYPAAYDTYRAAFEARKSATGKALEPGAIIWHVVCAQPPRLAIANAITQDLYGRTPGAVYVDYDAVRAVFAQVAQVARKHDLPVHYPLIGAGLAGGDWARIAAIIDQELEGVEHTVWTLPGAPRPPGPR